MKLRKQGKVWHLRYRLPDGTRISESTELTNKDRAVDEAKAKNEQLERGEIRSKADLVEHRGRSFRSLADAFLSDYPGWSERTRGSMGPIVRKLVEKFGDTPLEDITTAGLTRHLADRVRGGLDARASYNRYRSCLSSMFSWAMDLRMDD